MKIASGFALALVSFALGFVVAVFLGDVHTQDIVTVSSNMTFHNKVAPMVEQFTVKVAGNEKIQWVGLAGGPMDSEPDALRDLEETLAWRFAPHDTNESHATFVASTLPMQEENQGYAVFVIASIKKPGLFGSEKYVDTRLYWFPDAVVPDPADDPSDPDEDYSVDFEDPDLDFVPLPP